MIRSGEGLSRLSKAFSSLMMVGSFLFLVSTYVSIAVNSLSLGLMAIGWLGMMVSERRWAIRRTPLDLFFLAYVCAEVVATVFSVNHLQSVVYAKRLLLIGIVYFYASTMIDERSLRHAVAVLLGTATLVATFGVVKLIFGSAAENVRLGIFQFYMTTSELMMMAFLLILPFALHPGTPARLRVLAFAALVPVGISLYATVTRGAYLAAGAGMLFIAVTRHRLLLVPFLAGLILLLFFAPPYVAARLHSITDLQHPENISRIQMWTAGVRIWEEHPLVGVGDIDLGELMREHADPGYSGEWGHLHNVALNILVTLGAVGFAAVMTLFVKIAAVEWKIFRRVRDEWFLGSLVLGALAVYTGFQVNGLVEWSFGDQEVVIIFWITVGLSLAVGTLPLRTRLEEAAP
jgi:putative inorganic carbon (HCO3(-)) transporter